ncbi:Palmitoyltransferase pfa4 [Ceratocystis lukuohia]|uniref:Palmitoyltransferase PFA4 n=1 Tax=Ceratocystis lukuohia TaxID=2019550 RepID=A0ABR4MC45_9PEZI
MAGLLAVPGIQRLIVPFVCLLILFLTFVPQFLFAWSSDPDSSDYLAPGPLSRFQTQYINGLAALIFYTYYRTCFTDPGHLDYGISPSELSGESDPDWSSFPRPPGTRWCHKCDRPKPPRAHHCKLCGRCIPRMDHHCPWTSNCVSLRTFPHFVRFLISANLGLAALMRLVYQRAAGVWAMRHEPAYLGPSVPILVGLAVVSIVTAFTLLALAIILFTTLRAWLLNETTIEGWQRDRHTAVLSKGPGWWPTDDGDKVRVQHVEFPYDIDFFTNLAEGMSTYNPLLWLFPFTPTPKLGYRGCGLGWEYPENGFNQRFGMWPPPDPSRNTHNGTWPASKLPLSSNGADDDVAILRWSSVEEQKAAFQKRQLADRRRWAMPAGPESGHVLGEVDSDTDLLAQYDSPDERETAVRAALGSDEDSDYELFDGPPPSWRNNDGETLDDFGVEENSDDDVPLGELIRRRKARANNIESE